MKSFFMILVTCALIFSAGTAFGSDLEFEVAVSEGVKVEKVKPMMIFPPEKIVPLYVLPKELRDIVLARGEGQEFNFQVFSPEETTVNVRVLEPTEMVVVLTPRVGITKDNDFVGVASILILQPKGAKRKNHLTLQFVSEDKVLATTDIYVRLPLADKYFSVNVDRGKCEDEIDPWYTQLSIGVGVRTRSTDTSIGWRKDMEDQEDEGGWYFSFNCWIH